MPLQAKKQESIKKDYQYLFLFGFHEPFIMEKLSQKYFLSVDRIKAILSPRSKLKNAATKLKVDDVIEYRG